MSIEVLPLGTKCNIGCKYCYQEPTRSNPNYNPGYNKERLLATLRRIKEPWILFGGEPLLVTLPDLEEMLKIGYETTGETSIQTNGTLITPRHVELFAKYNTHVGMSLDGPDELNDARWAGTLEATRKMTKRSCDAVVALVEKAHEVGNLRLIPSFIVQLHSLNASPERFPRLKDWFRYLDTLGVQSIQYHLLDLDNGANDLYLDTERLKTCVLELWDLHTEMETLRFKELLEILTAQQGKAVHTCVWHACDPWNTSAVEGVNGDGTPTQCGRAGSNDGVDWVPAEGMGTPSVSRSSGFQGNRYHERQLSLYVTPQEQGGCKDCRFWLMCQSHCPGSGQPSIKDPQGDWRNRSVYCEVFKALFTEGERRLLSVGQQPVSLWKNRIELEHRLYTIWASGKEAPLQSLIAESKGTLPRYVDVSGHGDHSDTSVTQSHGDAPHGDSQHGDHIDSK